MKVNLYLFGVFACVSLGATSAWILKPQTKHITFHMNDDKSDLSFMQLDEAKGTVTIYEKDGDVNQVFTCKGGFKK